MSREKQLVKNTMVLSIGNVLPKFASLITLPIYTAMLTKAEYGTYDLVTVFVSLLLPIVTLQIQQAAFRFLIKEKDSTEQKSLIANTLFFVIPAALLCTVVVFFFLKIDILNRAIISLYLLVEIYYSVVGQIMRGIGKTPQYTVMAIINTIVNLFLVFPLLMWLKLGLTGLMLSLTISYLASVVYGNIKLHVTKYIDIHLIDRYTLKKLLNYSIPMVPNTVSQWIVRLSDRLMISIFLGVEANAVYAVANKFPQLFSVVQSTFTLAWQESASLATDEKEGGGFYSSIFDNLFNILTSFMSVLIAFTPIMFTIFIRGDYGDALKQMPLLYVGMIFSSLASFYGGLYIAHMKTKSIAITTILAAILNVLINFLLMNSIGLYAASLSTLISYLVLSIYRAIDVRKFHTIYYNWKKIIVEFMIVILVSVIFFINNFYLNIINIFIAMIFSIVINKKIIVATIKMLSSKLLKNK